MTKLITDRTEELQIEYLPVGSLKPYDKNARIHDDEDVEALMQSIRDYGFSDPVGVWGPENLIVEGHGRLEAAKRLKMERVPVIHLDHMSEEQQRAYRLVHNRTAELSFWDTKLMKREAKTVTGLNLDAFRFFTEDRKQAAWQDVQKYCNLKKDIRTGKMGDKIITSFFRTGKNGIEIEKIKESRETAANIAVILSGFLLDTFGGELEASPNWALVTTPRRHHRDYHFATDICRQAAEALRIRFYPDLITTEQNSKRIRETPEFVMKNDPQEDNLILFDDIITTGITLGTTRDLLIDYGHIVYSVVAIKN